LDEKRCIVQADLVFMESDGDYNRAWLTNVGFGPFSIGGETSLSFEKKITVNDSSIPASISVVLSYQSSAQAKGNIKVLENGNEMSNKSLTIDWKYALPTAGPVRDGYWSGGISSPIYLYFNFTTHKGVLNSISYTLVDSRTLNFGTVGCNDTAIIGTKLTAGQFDGIEMIADFIDFMKAKGTINLELTSGDTTLPFTMDWYPSYPRK
jgi:hypothetical protein